LLKIGQAGTCTVLNIGCEEGQCCVRKMGLGLLRGLCTTGMEGEKCGGINDCKCQEGLSCENTVCVSLQTTTTPQHTTAQEPTTDFGTFAPSTEIPETEPPAQNWLIWAHDTYGRDSLNCDLI